MKRFELIDKKLQESYYYSYVEFNSILFSIYAIGLITGAMLSYLIIK